MNNIKFWLANRKIKKEKKREEYFKKQVGPKRRVCQMKECKNKLKGFTYNCPYCKKKFCPKHRLPEKHKCLNPSKPSEMRIFGSKTQRKL